MKNRNKIDDLFSEALTGYKVEPSLGLWLRIERRFFPPSKFRPSGLITSILLLVLAGLMPWILIPANNNEDQEPNLPEGNNYHRGYLIQSSDQEQILRDGSPDAKISGKTYSIKPTVYQAIPVDPAGNPSTQFIASINDPAEDPAIRPILSANQKNYNLLNVQKPVQEQGTMTQADNDWIYRMTSRPSGLLNAGYYDEGIDSESENLPGSAFSSKYENDYFKKMEISTGLNFNPSVVFYDPNPYNKMLGGEAVVHLKSGPLSLMTGVGFSRMADQGSYKFNYISNDSVGFYLRVVSFAVDPRKPGQITYITREEAIYDSIPHYELVERTNYYSYIDIPLSFGYTFLQKNRVTLTASAGIKFSVLVAKDEPTVDFWISDAELVDIERQVPARLNTNWRFTAGVDFGYLFTEKFSLHLEPVFEQYISPIYAKEPGYKPKKPSVTGVKAGIRYTF